MPSSLYSVVCEFCLLQILSSLQILSRLNSIVCEFWRERETDEEGRCRYSGGRGPLHPSLETGMSGALSPPGLGACVTTRWCPASRNIPCAGWSPRPRMSALPCPSLPRSHALLRLSFMSCASLLFSSVSLTLLGPSDVFMFLFCFSSSLSLPLL